MVCHATEDPIQERIRELHAQGLNDREIARIVGCSSWTVGDRRMGMRLTNACEIRRSQTDARIRELHAKGLSGAEIGREIGISKGHANHRMISLGLREPNSTTDPTGRGRPDTTDYAEIDRRAMAYALIVLGKTDDEIARACDVELEAVRKYRREIPAWWRKEMGHS